MDVLAARYPFLTDAREAVEAADVDLIDLVSDGDDPVLERALDRVEAAIDSGTVGAPHRSPRVELLSYPVARVLVSLVNDPGLTRRYAHAEAETALARLRADREGNTRLKSIERDPLTLDRLLAEFELADAVERVDDGFAVEVAAYLALTDGLDDDRWRLVSRELASGAIPVTAGELETLLREAVHDRVAGDLPLSVPEAINEALEPAIAELRAQLAEYGSDWGFEIVEPALFPPCVEALLARAAEGDDLSAHSRFALASFLATVGMRTEDVVERLATHPSIDVETAASLVDHVADEAGAEYPPPSCATMVAYGDCVNQDALCARIGHPLAYYERRLAGEDPETLEVEGIG